MDVLSVFRETNQLVFGNKKLFWKVLVLFFFNFLIAWAFKYLGFPWGIHAFAILFFALIVEFARGESFKNSFKVFKNHFVALLIIAVIYILMEIGGDMVQGYVGSSTPALKVLMQSALNLLVSILAGWTLFAVYETVEQKSSLGHSLKKSLKVYFRSFLKIAVVGLLVGLPVLAISGGYFLYITYLFKLNTTADPAEGLRYLQQMKLVLFGFSLAGLIIGWITGVYMQLANYVMAKKLMQTASHK